MQGGDKILHFILVNHFGHFSLKWYMLSYNISEELAEKVKFSFYSDSSPHSEIELWTIVFF